MGILKATWDFFRNKSWDFKSSSVKILGIFKINLRKLGFFGKKVKKFKILVLNVNFFGY